MKFNIILQSIESPFVTSFFKFFTFFGSLAFAEIFVCLIYITLSKKNSFVYISSFAFSMLSCFALKNIFKIPRPFDRNANIKKLTDVSGYSFPSGHSTNITAMSTIVSTKFYKHWWIYLFGAVLSILVMLSRIYLGVHTIWDCLLGLTIGICLTLFVSFLLNKLNNYNILSIIIASICFVVMFVFVSKFLTYNKTAIDVLKFCGAGVGFYLGYFLERKFINFNIEEFSLKQRFILSVIGVIIFVPVAVVLLFFKSIALIWFFRMFALTIILTVLLNFILKVIAKRLNYGKTV